MAFDAASGKKLWEIAHGAGSATTRAMVRARRRPLTAIDSTDSVPAAICPSIDAATGKVAWKVNVLEQIRWLEHSAGV